MSQPLFRSRKSSTYKKYDHFCLAISDDSELESLIELNRNKLRRVFHKHMPTNEKISINELNKFCKTTVIFPVNYNFFSFLDSLTQRISIIVIIITRI